MTNRNHVLTTGEYYHIYNRGNSKQNIFLDTQDYIIFQQLLYLMNMERRIALRDVTGSVYSYERTTPLVSIGAYCLMPNHVHILVKQIGNGGISKYTQKLFTAYAMYFNKKYIRSGGLFEGVFKSKHVTNDLYLQYLFAYIHLNPIKIHNVSWKEDIKRGKKVNPNHALLYPFSSILDYLDQERIESRILKKSDFPFSFKDSKEMMRNILSWFRHPNFT